MEISAKRVSQISYIQNSGITDEDIITLKLRVGLGMCTQMLFLACSIGAKDGHGFLKEIITNCKKDLDH